GDVHPGVGEQLADPVGGRLPGLLGVLVEVLSAGIGGVREALECAAALDGDLVRLGQGVEGHRVEVDVGEVDALFRAVVDPLPGEVAVQVHLPQPDRVRVVVALLDRGHRVDVRLVGDRGQGPDRGADALAEVRGVHRGRDVHRAQVAGDVLAHVRIRQVVVVGGGGGEDRKSIRLNSSHVLMTYAIFCLYTNSQLCTI